MDIKLSEPSQQRGVTDVTSGMCQIVNTFRLGYANTMCKVQSEKVLKAILSLDDDIPAGTAYVALSRVQEVSDVLFLAPLKTSLFKPVLQA